MNNNDDQLRVDLRIYKKIIIKRTITEIIIIINNFEDVGSTVPSLYLKSILTMSESLRVSDAYTSIVIFVVLYISVVNRNDHCALPSARDHGPLLIR